MSSIRMGRGMVAYVRVKVLREIMELLIKCNGSWWNQIFVVVVAVDGR